MGATLSPLERTMKPLPFTAAFLVIACSLSISAKDKRLPLAPQLISAKTVYIDNRSEYAAIGDRAYQEITSWGRFQVVQDRSQADLIFLLTARAETRGYIT